MRPFRVIQANVNGTDYLAEEMADAMLTNTTVSMLSLESNSITNGDGVIALAAMLRTNTTLEKLRLGNQVSAVPTRALHRLASAIAEDNTTLTVCSIQVSAQGPQDG